MNYRSFKLRPGQKLRLNSTPTEHTGGFADETEAEEEIKKETERLAKYQDILFAHKEHSVLVLFQGMDSSGKDETIQRVMSSVDPQGCITTKFKAMSETELRHDYLWRYVQGLPERGQIGIFNRSYYEQVIAERVHPETLEKQGLPPALRRKDIWRKRFRQINNFEEYLTQNGIVVLKFFLHISKESQRERLLERIESTDKKWQFSPDDIEDRDRWDDFMKCYQEMLHNTNTRHAPWYVIPGDHRWFEYAAVSSLIVSTLRSLHSRYPTASREQQRELDRARKQLLKS